jgi:sulfur carrier protein ThiS
MERSEAFLMRIRVRLQGYLHGYTESKSPEFDLELPSRITLAELIHELKIPDSEVWVASLNGQNVPLSTALSNNDQVIIFPPITGG